MKGQQWEPGKTVTTSLQEIDEMAVTRSHPEKLSGSLASTKHWGNKKGL